jgi:hypothetical protein
LSVSVWYPLLWLWEPEGPPPLTLSELSTDMMIKGERNEKDKEKKQSWLLKKTEKQFQCEIAEKNIRIEEWEMINGIL